MGFLGCDQVGSSPSDEDFGKIQLGMTEDEVNAVLGEPEKAITHPQVKSIRMLEWGGDSRVVLDNGKVDAVVLHEETILENEPDELVLEPEE